MEEEEEQNSQLQINCLVELKWHQGFSGVSEKRLEIILENKVSFKSVWEVDDYGNIG